MAKRTAIASKQEQGPSQHQGVAGTGSLSLGSKIQKISLFTLVQRLAQLALFFYTMQAMLGKTSDESLISSEMPWIPRSMVARAQGSIMIGLDDPASCETFGGAFDTDASSNVTNIVVGGTTRSRSMV
jgi:hypothetical protein